MKCVFVILLMSLLLCGNSSAQRSPNNALGQIGADGATAVGGDPAYANYLLLLDSNGLVNASMMPGGLTNVGLQQVLFLDAFTGDDTVGDGTIVNPYKTFGHAVSVASNATVYVFSPGAYGSLTISDATITHIILAGWDPENTSITLLKMNNLENSIVDIYGMHIDTVQQANNKTLDLGVYERASVDTVNMVFTHVNSWLTLKRDPSVFVTTKPVTFITDRLTHDSEDMQYISGDITDWYGLVPTNIEEALDTLASRALVDAGTNVGQLTYWNGTNWTYLAATTNDTWVLHGGNVPYFAYMAASNVVYTNASVPAFSNVWDALDTLISSVVVIPTNDLNEILTAGSWGYGHNIALTNSTLNIDSPPGWTSLYVNPLNVSYLGQAYQSEPSEYVDADRQLTIDDSGKCFVMTGSLDVAFLLPTNTTVTNIGWHCRFINLTTNLLVISSPADGSIDDSDPGGEIYSGFGQSNQWPWSSITVVQGGSNWWHGAQTYGDWTTTGINPSTLPAGRMHVLFDDLAGSIVELDPIWSGVSNQYATTNWALATFDLQQVLDIGSFASNSAVVLSNSTLHVYENATYSPSGLGSLLPGPGPYAAYIGSTSNALGIAGGTNALAVVGLGVDNLVNITGIGGGSDWMMNVEGSTLFGGREKILRVYSTLNNVMEVHTDQSFALNVHASEGGTFTADGPGYVGYFEATAPYTSPMGNYALRAVSAGDYGIQASAVHDYAGHFSAGHLYGVYGSASNYGGYFTALPGNIGLEVDPLSYLIAGSSTVSRLTVSNTSPFMCLYDSNGGFDEKRVCISTDQGLFRIRHQEDDGTLGSTIFYSDRVGDNATWVSFPSGIHLINSTAIRGFARSQITGNSYESDINRGILQLEVGTTQNRMNFGLHVDDTTNAWIRAEHLASGVPLPMYLDSAGVHYKEPYEYVGTDRQLVLRDSGKCFVMTGAVDVAFLLPVDATFTNIGWHCRFINLTTNLLVIRAPVDGSVDDSDIGGEIYSGIDQENEWPWSSIQIVQANSNWWTGSTMRGNWTTTGIDPAIFTPPPIRGVGGTASITGNMTRVEYGVTYTTDMIPTCSPTTNFTELANIEIANEDREGFTFRVTGSGGVITDPWKIKWNANPSQ